MLWETIQVYFYAGFWVFFTFFRLKSWKKKNNSKFYASECLRDNLSHIFLQFELNVMFEDVLKVIYENGDNKLLAFSKLIFLKLWFTFINVKYKITEIKTY